MRSERNRLRISGAAIHANLAARSCWSPATRLAAEHGQRAKVSRSMNSIATFRHFGMLAGGYGRRMSRGLIGDDDLAAKLTRLRNRITEASRAFNHSGLPWPARSVVRPRGWQASAIRRSSERTDSIMRSRKQRKAWSATTQWMLDVDRRGICELEIRASRGRRSNAGSADGRARDFCGEDGREAGFADAGGR